MRQSELHPQELQVKHHHHERKERREKLKPSMAAAVVVVVGLNTIKYMTIF